MNSIKKSTIDNEKFKETLLNNIVLSGGTSMIPGFGERIQQDLVNYDDNEFLDKGTFWFKQGHIFSSAFYYIDYTLAQICAYQFWLNSRLDKENAWQDYLNICKVGGSQSFLDIIKTGNLRSPFEEEAIHSVSSEIKEYLDSIDDLKL